MNPTTTITESSIQVEKLENGLTVLLEPLPFLRSVSIGLWIQAGSACEQPHQAGISHFLEHLFFKGTDTRTARQLAEAVERYGGQLNGFTSRDSTCLYAMTLDSHVSTGIEVLADIVKNSQFPDFEKEKGVVLEEIASVEDVPEEHLHDLFVQRLWPDHAMGTPITGSQETVTALSIDDVQGYHDVWYRPSNMILAVAGSFDSATVFAQIEDEFAGLSPSTVSQPDSVPIPTACVEAFDRTISQSHVCFGFPGPSVTHADRFAYDLLNCTLGGGATSRLFDNIREREGLAYSIYSFLSGFRSGGFAGVYAATSPDNLARTADLAFDELRNLCDEPMSTDELGMNRDQLKGGLLMALERTFSRMMRMGKSTMYHGRVIPIDEIIASLDAVTLEDVQRVAQQTFVADRCVLLTLGPATARVGKIAL